MEYPINIHYRLDSKSICIFSAYLDTKVKELTEKGEEFGAA